MPAKNKGFTLIELLVVIAIIGILTTLIVGGFRSSQIRARDGRRKADLKEIANALEQYYNDYQHYPVADAGRIVGCPVDSNGACTWGDDAFEHSANNTTYMKMLPSDPGAYNYIYRTVNTQTGFQLYTHVENPEDKNCLLDLNGNVSCDNPRVKIDCGGGSVCNFAITSGNTDAYATADP